MFPISAFLLSIHRSSQIRSLADMGPPDTLREALGIFLSKSFGLALLLDYPKAFQQHEWIFFKRQIWIQIWPPSLTLRQLASILSIGFLI